MRAGYRWMVAAVTAVAVAGGVYAQEGPVPMEGAGGPPPMGGGPGGGPQDGMRGKWGARGGGFGGEEHGPEAFVERMMNNPALAAELGFTEEQVKKLKTALGDLSKKEIDLRAELDKGGIDQAKLMSETTLDEKAILAAVEKAEAIRTDLAKLKIQQLLLIRKSLTPEQMEKIKEMIRQHMKERMNQQGDRNKGNHKGQKDWKKMAAPGTNTATVTPPAPAP